MLPIACGPERFEDIERDRGVVRALHVDADEEALRAVEDAAQVGLGAGPIDVESELRQFQRQVAPDA